MASHGISSTSYQTTSSDRNTIGVATFHFSENLLAAIPIWLVEASGARVFSIRWLGALHLFLFVCAYYALLIYLRGRGNLFQLLIGMLALWIFTDVALCFVLQFLFLRHGCVPRPDVSDRPGVAPHGSEPGLGGAAVFHGRRIAVCSSFEIAIVRSEGVVIAVFCGRPSAEPRAADRLCNGTAWRRGLDAASHAARILRTASVQPDLLQNRAGGAPSLWAAIREFGLGPAEYSYIGTHSYTPGNPTSAEWFADFQQRTGFAKALRYWLRHPGEAVQAASPSDLVHQAHELRPPKISRITGGRMDIHRFRLAVASRPGAISAPLCITAGPVTLFSGTCWSAVSALFCVGRGAGSVALEPRRSAWVFALSRFLSSASAHLPTP